LGLELALPHELLFQHPFPGPGLAVRVLGEIKKTYIELLKKSRFDIFRGIIKE